MIAAELCLHGFQKIPFTCSYLPPGKSYFHTAVLEFLALLFLITKGAGLERSALEDPACYARMIGILSVAAALARLRTGAQAKSKAAALQFEEAPDRTILPLGLYRDGVLPIEP